MLPIKTIEMRVNMNQDKPRSVVIQPSNKGTRIGRPNLVLPSREVSNDKTDRMMSSTSKVRTDEVMPSNIKKMLISQLQNTRQSSTTGYQPIPKQEARNV